MAISETARRNHDLLFPGHVSTLAVTDPELIEYFDNFAFDEVLQAAPLDTHLRLITQLGALIAVGALGEYRVDARRRAQRRGHPCRGQGGRLPGRALRRDGPSVRLPPRHQRHPRRTWHQPAPRGPVDDHARHEVRARAGGAGRDHRRRQGRSAVRHRQHPTSCTSNTCCRRTASATTTPEPASTYRPASCSRSRCSSPSAAANPRSPAHVTANLRVGNDRRLLVAVTTQLLPFIGYPRTLNALA